MNQHGRPALLAAAISGDDSIADALLRRGANAIDGSGEALLMGTADVGSEAVTKLLLRHGAMADAVNRHGCTARLSGPRCRCRCPFWPPMPTPTYDTPTGRPR